jgi:hypothetical protein
MNPVVAASCETSRTPKDRVPAPETPSLFNEASQNPL